MQKKAEMRKKKCKKRQRGCSYNFSYWGLTELQTNMCYNLGLLDQQQIRLKLQWNFILKHQINLSVKKIEKKIRKIRKH